MSEKVAGEEKKKFKKPSKKKVCIFCQNKEEKIDYKDVAKLKDL